jgi:hypothetical protein
MRHLRLAAFALLVLPPAIVAAATPGWQTATATSVNAGVTSKSTFQIQAYVTLPQSCDMARIRTLAITSQLHRSFIVEQMAPSAPCTGKTVYKCTVVSPNFSLPIPHKFDVDSKGKTWGVTLSMASPQPVEPLCRKS